MSGCEEECLRTGHIPKPKMAKTKRGCLPEEEERLRVARQALPSIETGERGGGKESGCCSGNFVRNAIAVGRKRSSECRVPASEARCSKFIQCARRTPPCLVAHIWGLSLWGRLAVSGS